MNRYSFYYLSILIWHLASSFSFAIALPIKDFIQNKQLNNPSVLAQNLGNSQTQNYLEQAELKLQSGEYEAALTDYNRVIELDSNIAEAFAAELFLQQGQTESYDQIKQMLQQF